MGCDIHTYREARVDGKWVSLNDPDNDRMEELREDDPDDPMYAEGSTVPALDLNHDRWYYQFSMLGLKTRGRHKCPMPNRGMPDDVSPEVKKASDIWDVDGHNHNHHTLAELKKHKGLMMVQSVGTETVDPLIYDTFEQEHLDRFSPDDLRIVFWFDN